MEKKNKVYESKQEVMRIFLNNQKYLKEIYDDFFPRRFQKIPIGDNFFLVDA